jgi:uncharacterized LabA/DUF88 family protein
VGFGPRAFSFLWAPGVSLSPVPVKRVAAFVDGFNLYHAINDTGADYLKWLDLRKLCENFAPLPQWRLDEVFYFSAYATWLPGPYARHRTFVQALESTGVTAIMGEFKEKSRRCRACGNRWRDHEEKETDVNIALWMLRAAGKDRFDRALLVTGDSDLTPAVTMVRELYPEKEIQVLAPLGGQRRSSSLGQATGRPVKDIKRIHLERSLFPEVVSGATGSLQRPAKYDPPKPPGASP